MALNRCPDCGRVFDGTSCFACGYESPDAAPEPAPAEASRPAPSSQPAANPFLAPAGSPEADLVPTPQVTDSVMDLGFDFGGLNNEPPDDALEIEDSQAPLELSDEARSVDDEGLDFSAFSGDAGFDPFGEEVSDSEHFIPGQGAPKPVETPAADPFPKDPFAAVPLDPPSDPFNDVPLDGPDSDAFFAEVSSEAPAIEEPPTAPAEVSLDGNFALPVPEPSSDSLQLDAMFDDIVDENAQDEAPKPMVVPSAPAEEPSSISGAEVSLYDRLLALADTLHSEDRLRDAELVEQAAERLRDD